MESLWAESLGLPSMSQRSIKRTIWSSSVANESRLYPESFWVLFRCRFRFLSFNCKTTLHQSFVFPLIVFIWDETLLWRNFIQNKDAVFRFVIQRVDTAHSLSSTLNWKQTRILQLLNSTIKLKFWLRFMWNVKHLCFPVLYFCALKRTRCLI